MKLVTEALPDPVSGKAPALLVRARRELSRVGDARRAAGARAYMKSVMPYHGVSTPLLRESCTKIFAGLVLPSCTLWRDQVLSLWRGAKFREERYVAIALTGHKLAKAFQTPAAMPLYEEIIVTGAWWDYVDDVAAHRVGPILRDNPAVMKRKMLAWSRSGNMWKRRASIICQLGFKQNTDLGLLYACIEPSMDSKEFFLRKAIGWALRQYAWIDPAEVKRCARRNRARLSGLSYRQALKNV
ncbi:MAG: DNA alkylation repair protein [Candidatus Acidiferrales bacterium]